jgi:hypothetical protein
MDKDKKADLINELNFMYERIHSLWEFHPDNPERRDVLKETLELKKIIRELETEIDQLD